MGENGDEFEGDHEAGSFSQLLFSDEGVVGLDDISLPTLKNFPPSFPPVHTNNNHPKMLCFGDYQNNELDSPFLCSSGQQQQQSVVACPDSSSASSCNRKVTKKRNGSTVKPVQGTCTGSGARAKKSKPENPVPGGHAKVRKEKLGERIATLQQLVSPFGKTDTASVLHEAMGYIKFLQDQVQVLCSPYLLHEHLPRVGGNGEDVTRKDLRSRGLCLVPVSCTAHVANTNGADFWSPAAMNNMSSSSRH